MNKTAAADALGNAIGKLEHVQNKYAQVFNDYEDRDLGHDIEEAKSKLINVLERIEE